MSYLHIHARSRALDTVGFNQMTVCIRRLAGTLCTGPATHGLRWLGDTPRPPQGWERSGTNCPPMEPRPFAPTEAFSWECSCAVGLLELAQKLGCPCASIGLLMGKMR